MTHMEEPIFKAYKKTDKIFFNKFFQHIKMLTGMKWNVKNKD